MWKKFWNKVLCSHKWVVHDQTNVHGYGSAIPYKQKQTLICTECGKIKKIIL